MLGWEFPPAFAGGLGVACYNIVKSLSPQANITLIVPYAESAESQTNLKVIGLNQLEKEDVTTPGQDVMEWLNVIYRIPIELSAYPPYLSSQTILDTEVLFHQTPSLTSWTDLSNKYFKTSNLYDDNIHVRTHLFAETVKHISEKLKYEIIHAHDWPTFTAAVELKEKRDRPVVAHVHSLETDRAGDRTRNTVFDLEKNSLDKADKIIAVSEYTKQQMVLHYSINPTKISVAHNGAEKTNPFSFKKKVNEKWVTFVGRITFQKGPQFVVETAAKLVKVNPDVRFVIAGIGDMLPALIHEVARLRLGKYFMFTGFLSREKVNQLLSCSDAYFMPSVSEPFGLSAVEAAQQGVASVISSRSGAAEVLPHALQADFWDTDKFANYLNAILKYPKLRSFLQKGAISDVQNITWNNTADKIMSVYNELVAA